MTLLMLTTAALPIAATLGVLEEVLRRRSTDVKVERIDRKAAR